MCGRYNVIDNPELRELLDVLGIELVLPTRLNLAPTDSVPVVIEVDGRRHCKDMRWWLLPSWAKELSTKYSMFNARSENLRSSRAFARPFKRQRAVMPASSFIEWQKREGQKLPILIEAEGRALAFAAIFEQSRIDDQLVHSCAIITRPAADEFAPVHSRMPVMLEPAEFDEWLDPKVELSEAYPAFSPVLSSPLLLSDIDKSINNSRNKEASAIVKLNDAQRISKDA